MSPVEDFPIEVDSDEGLFRNSDFPTATALKQAAVLVPFVQVKNEWHLLFIVRATNPNDRHSGQVAFPGGRKDATDTSLEHTALRETQEEIGVHSEHIEVISTLSPYVTVSDYAVTPVVAIMQWPQALTLETSEVARTLTLPVSWLSDRGNLSLRARSEFDKQTSERHPVVVYKEQQDCVLWGATARITLNCFKANMDGELTIPSLELTNL